MLASVSYTEMMALLSSSRFPCSNMAVYSCCTTDDTGNRIAACHGFRHGDEIGHDARMLDLRFADLPGLWQHVSYPIGMLTEDSFEEGFGFDGSSLRGWKNISESDMIVVPEPATASLVAVGLLGLGAWARRRAR